MAKLKLLLKHNNQQHIANYCLAHLIKNPIVTDTGLVIGDTAATCEFTIDQDCIDGAMFDYDLSDDRYAVRLTLRNIDGDVLFTPEVVHIDSSALPIVAKIRCADVTICIA